MSAPPWAGRFHSHRESGRALPQVHGPFCVRAALGVERRHEARAFDSQDGTSGHAHTLGNFKHPGCVETLCAPSPVGGVRGGLNASTPRRLWALARAR